MDFGPALLWDWNENWSFPALWPLLSYLISWVTWFPCLIDNEDHILFCELLWDSMSSSALLLLLPLFSFLKGFSAGLLGFCFYPFLSLCFMSNCIPFYFLINLVEISLTYNLVLTSAVQQSDSGIHKYFLYGLSQETGYSSLCNTAGPCWFFILNVTACTYEPQPHGLSFSPLPSPLATASLLSASVILFCRQVYCVIF